MTPFIVENLRQVTVLGLKNSAIAVAGLNQAANHSCGNLTHFKQLMKTVGTISSLLFWFSISPHGFNTTLMQLSFLCLKIS
jgi:hypothetical protein